MDAPYLMQMFERTMGLAFKRLPCHRALVLEADPFSQASDRTPIVSMDDRQLTNVTLSCPHRFIAGSIVFVTPSHIELRQEQSGKMEAII